MVKPRRLAQAQELVREGLPVLLVRVLDEVALVQLSGERAAIVLVVALPEVKSSQVYTPTICKNSGAL